MPSMATMSNWFATNNSPVRKSKPPSVRSFCSLTSLFFLSPSRILYITLFGDGATLAQKLFSEGLTWKLINRVVMNYFVGNWLEHFPMRLNIITYNNRVILKIIIFSLTWKLRFMWNMQRKTAAEEITFAYKRQFLGWFARHIFNASSRSPRSPENVSQSTIQ